MRKQLFKFETKVKQMSHRFYFESGMSLLSYAKYLFIFISLDNVVNKSNLSSAILWGIAYAFLCYIVGYFYVRSDYAKAYNEVSNRLNKFVLEVRKKLK